MTGYDKFMLLYRDSVMFLVNLVVISDLWGVARSRKDESLITRNWIKPPSDGRPASRVKGLFARLRQ